MQAYSFVDPFGPAGDLSRIPGFSGVSEAELRKAVDAGLPVHSTGSGRLDAIMPEDLSPLVTELVFQSKHIRFGRALAMAEAKSSLHQFARVTDIGGLIDDFVTEGGGPSVDADPTWDRPNVQLRQITRAYRVTHMAQEVDILQGAGGNAKSANQRLAIIGAERNLEYARFKGANAHNPRSFDGLETLLSDAETAAGLTDTYVINMNGEQLTPQIIDQYTIAIADRYGEPSALWCSNGVRGQLSQLQLAYARDILPMGARRRAVEQGASVDRFLSSPEFEISYEPTVVLQPEFIPLVAAGVGSSKPSTPTMSAQPSAGAPGGSEESFFAAADAATYRYKLVAYGKNGQSVPVETNTVSVAKGQKVSMTVNDAAVTLVDRYGVWRKKGSGPYQFMKFVAFTGSPTVITDLNADRPGTSSAFLMSMTPQTIQEVCLGAKKFVEYPIAFGTDATNPTSWGYLLITYRAMALRAPQWIVQFKNCRNA